MSLYGKHSSARWYDYVFGAWVVYGKYSVCGHPEEMKPSCCYAGRHAGEVADLSHYPAITH